MRTPTIVQHTRDIQARKQNILYQPCRRLEKTEILSLEFQKFIKEMHHAMNIFNGIGIAANQIGHSIQTFMIEAQSDNPRYAVLGAVPFQTFINPKITRASSTLYNFWHGCLSAEGEKRGNVATYEWVEYECLDENAELKKGRLDGLAAVIFQHEFRHLLGHTYLDRASEFLSKEELEEEINNKTQFFYEKSSSKLPHLIGDYRVGDSLEDFYKTNSSRR